MSEWYKKIVDNVVDIGREEMFQLLLISRDILNELDESDEEESEIKRILNDGDFVGWFSEKGVASLALLDTASSRRLLRGWKSEREKVKKKRRKGGKE